MGREAGVGKEGQQSRLGSVSWQPFASVPFRRRYWGEQKRRDLKPQSLKQP